MSSAISTSRGLEQLVPARKASLVGEIVSSYVRMRLLLRRRGLEQTVERLRQPTKGVSATEGLLPPSEESLVGLCLANAVVQTLRVLPTDSRCLMRALVLLALLARRGLACTLVIGVSSAPEFKAHAWIELAGEPLLATGGEEYARLVEL
jgi:hypothetical protein